MKEQVSLSSRLHSRWLNPQSCASKEPDRHSTIRPTTRLVGRTVLWTSSRTRPGCSIDLAWLTISYYIPREMLLATLLCFHVNVCGMLFCFLLMCIVHCMIIICTHCGRRKKIKKLSSVSSGCTCCHKQCIYYIYTFCTWLEQKLATVQNWLNEQAHTHCPT